MRYMIIAVVAAMAIVITGCANGRGHHNNDGSERVEVPRTWPHFMEQAFMSGCKRGAFATSDACFEAMYWLERRYTMEQIAAHVDDKQWMDEVAAEAVSHVHYSSLQR